MSIPEEEAMHEEQSDKRQSEERPDKRRRTYNDHERRMIDPFKGEYLRAMNKDQRRNIAITKILSPLIAYWKEQGKVTTIEKKAVELMKWIRNNWRLSAADKPVPLVVRRSEVLWLNHREEVFEEIAVLLGVPKADASTPGWFSKRMKALGNILARKTEEELNAFDRECDEIAAEGYPKEQKIQLAEKYKMKRCDKVATLHYKEMGLLTITFIASTLDDGSLGVTLHDAIGKQLGVPNASFEGQNEGPVLQMKKLLFDYIRTLENMLAGGPSKLAGVPELAKPAGVEITSKGYPKLLSDFIPAKTNKRQLEQHICLYMNKHYKLATGGRTHRAPFAKLKRHLSDYIHPKFLPAGITITDPRNMTKVDIISFLEHIQEREKTEDDISQVFRFHNVQTSKGGVIKSRYPDEKVPDEEPVTPKKTYKKRQKQKNPVRDATDAALLMMNATLEDTGNPSWATGIIDFGNNISPRSEMSPGGHSDVLMATSHYPTPAASSPVAGPSAQASLHPPEFQHVYDPSLEGVAYHAKPRLPLSPAPSETAAAENTVGQKGSKHSAPAGQQVEPVAAENTGRQGQSVGPLLGEKKPAKGRRKVVIANVEPVAAESTGRQGQSVEPLLGQKSREGKPAKGRRKKVAIANEPSVGTIAEELEPPPSEEASGRRSRTRAIKAPNKLNL